MNEYFKLSQRPSYTYLLAVVLLLLYEGFAALLLNPAAGDSLNLIDVLFNEVLALLPFASWVLGVFIALIGLLLVWLDQREGVPIQRVVLLTMWAESLVWAIMLLFTMPLLAGVLLPNSAAGGGNLVQNWVLSLGAGFYEEFFFRFLLVKLLVFVAVLLGYAPGNLFTRIAIALLTAVIFSAAHHIVEPFSAYAFLYRTLFGLAMSMLMLYRGFGISSWAHAWYDVIVFSLA